jgi:hypothetical protein
MDSPCFFQVSFFLPNVHHSFLELKMILTLMIKMEKGFEPMNFFNINPFEHIWFKSAFDLQNYKF